MISKVSTALAMMLLTCCTPAGKSMQQNEELDGARQAFEKSEYHKAVQILQAAAAKEPRNGEIQLMLAKNYYELEERDAAVNSAEKAVAIDPENSVYHEWLGRAYGELIGVANSQFNWKTAPVGLNGTVAEKSARVSP